MFVLIKAWDGNLSGDNEVKGYDTFDLAFMSMIRQLEEDVAKEGHALKEVDWNAIAAGESSDIYDEDDLYCGTVGQDHAYCEYCDYEWQIFEV